MAIAEAAVDIVADTSRFDDTLKSGLASSRSSARESGDEAGSNWAQAFRNSVAHRLTGTAIRTALAPLKGVVGAIGFATLGAQAAAAAAGLVQFTAALAPAVGILAAAPAGIAVFGAALGTLKIALQGVGDAFGAALGDDAAKFQEAIKNLAPAAQTVARDLRSIKPEIDKLKQSVQGAFFEPLVGQFQALAQALAGPVTRGMTGVARASGQAAKQVSLFAQSSATVDALSAVFDTTRASIGAMVPAIQPLLAGFRDLAVVALPVVERLSNSLAEQATAFGEWMSQAAASGDALSWIEGAITVFEQLGTIVSQLGGIISGVFEAARTAGGNVLGVFGQLLTSMNQWVNSAAGQQQLVAIFRALGEIGSQLGPIFQAFGSTLALIAPQIANIATAMGPGIASAISALGPALAALGPGLTAVAAALSRAFANPQVQAGLLALGQSLSQLLVALAPLLPMIVQLAALFVTGLANGITLVASFLQPLVQRFVQLSGQLGWLKPLVTGLGTALAVLVAALIPIKAGMLAWSAVNTVVSSTLGKLLARVLWFTTKLVARIVWATAQVVARILWWTTVTLARVAAWTLRMVARVVWMTARIVARIVWFVAVTLARVAAWTARMLARFAIMSAQVIARVAIMSAQVVLRFAIMSARVLARVAVMTAQVILRFVMMSARVLARIAIMSAQVVLRFVMMSARVVARMAVMTAQVVARFAIMSAQVLARVAVMSAQVMARFTMMTVRAAAQVARMSAMVAARFAAMSARAIASMAAMAARVIGRWVAMAVASMANAARMAAAWVVAMGPIGWVTAAIVGLVALVVANWQKVKSWTISAWNAVSGAVSDAWNAVVSAVQTGISNVVSFVSSLPGKILGALGDLGSLLFNAGKNIIGGLIDGIKSMFGAVGDAVGSIVQNVKDFLPFSPARKGPLSGAGAPINSGRSIGRQLADGIASQRDRVARRMRDLVAQLSPSTRDAIGEAASGIRRDAPELWNFVRSIPSQVVSTLGNLGGLLRDAGQQIMDGLVDGLRGAAGRLWDFVSTIAGRIAELKGPLAYDRTLLMPHGQAIMGGLQRGLRAGMGPVERDIAALTRSIPTLSGTVTHQYAPAGPGAGRLTSSVTHQRQVQVHAPITVQTRASDPEIVAAHTADRLTRQVQP